jgi:acyl dehydratase
MLSAMLLFLLCSAAGSDPSAASCTIYSIALARTASPGTQGWVLSEIRGRMPIVINGQDRVENLVGTFLGPTDWQTIRQDRIGTFADATDDHQWIHVDAEKAETGPFGATIAHGYLTLSLLPHLLRGVLDVKGLRLGVNYGLERVRFPAPVPVGSRIRLQGRVSQAAEIEGGVELRVVATIEIEGSSKPACVAEPIYRYYV